MSSKKLTELGATLKRIRKVLHLSQLEVANRLGVTDSYISQLESGKKTEISQQLQKLITLEFPEIAAESREQYEDDLTVKIVDRLKVMTKEQKRQVLHFIEGMLLLAKRDKKGEDSGGSTGRRVVFEDE